MTSFPNHLRSLTLVSALSAALAGCSMAPIYQRPAPPVPAQWEQAQSVISTSVSSARALDWRSFVTDDGLRTLVGMALDNNRDLRQALLNIEAARAQYRIQRADRLPGIDAQASGTRQRVPADISPSGQAQIQESYQAGVGLTSFELDLFGRVRNLSESSLQQYLATEEAARAVQTSLVAEVVQAYLTRDSAQQRKVLTRHTLESREASLRLIERRRQAGTATALDNYEARGLVEQARADLERIDREFRQSTHALGLLVGVSDLSGYLPQQPTSNALLVQELAPGTPSELLEQRPDIRAAEFRLRARNADIGAARAAFFPRISLTGLFGSTSADLSDLFGAGQRAWSFAPQITLPIFDGGRNRAGLELASVRKDMAVAEYEKTIQTAFREVADALAATDTLRREEAARKALADTSTQALKLSEARYRAGVDDHLRYLDAQRSDFANQIGLIQVTTQRQAALADLFRALGGGWDAGGGVRSSEAVGERGPDGAIAAASHRAPIEAAQ